MSKSERIVCQCGGELQRPIPPSCPHCGHRIVEVRRRILPTLIPVLTIALLFVLMYLFAMKLAGR